MASGYIGYSQSVRAAEAKGDGRMPLTHLVKRVRRFFPGVTSGDLRTILSPSEWHHTSKKFNRTDFYDLRDFADVETRRTLRARISARREYNVLYRQAIAAGLTDNLMANGEVWYPLAKYNANWRGARLADEIARLRESLQIQLAAKLAQVRP